MAKTNLGSMSVEQLLQLRDDVGKELNRKSTELRSQLARLGADIAPGRGPPSFDRKSSLWHRRFCCRLTPKGEPLAPAMQLGAHGQIRKLQEGWPLIRSVAQTMGDSVTGLIPNRRAPSSGGKGLPLPARAGARRLAASGA